jgi:hypothetical protein
MILLTAVTLNQKSPVAPLQQGTASSTNKLQKPVEKQPPSASPVAPIAKAGQWIYSNSDDSMGRKRSLAQVKSENTLHLGFPYQGNQHGTLVLRNSARWGTDVMVNIERGQFLCRFDGCTVNVRFDDGPIQKYSASEPDDHSTTTMFLNNATRFISTLRKSKTVRVEATYYQEGSQTLEFNIEGLAVGR